VRDQRSIHWCPIGGDTILLLCTVAYTRCSVVSCCFFRGSSHSKHRAFGVVGTALSKKTGAFPAERSQSGPDESGGIALLRWGGALVGARRARSERSRRRSARADLPDRTGTSFSARHT
jgi:hypothetical protein